jgi:hypothetical protein
MAIRSSGRDHTWEGLTYTIGPFVTTNYNRDIVWADGLFMQYPAGISVVNAQAGPAP